MYVYCCDVFCLGDSMARIGSKYTFLQSELYSKISVCSNSVAENVLVCGDGLASQATS